MLIRLYINYFLLFYFLYSEAEKQYRVTRIGQQSSSSTPARLHHVQYNEENESFECTLQSYEFCWNTLQTYYSRCGSVKPRKSSDLTFSEQMVQRPQQKCLGSTLYVFL